MTVLPYLVLLLLFSGCESQTVNLTTSSNSSVVCPALWAIIPSGQQVDTIEQYPISSRVTLASTMLNVSSVPCPASEVSSNYVITAKSPNWNVLLNSASEVATVINWGAAPLAVVVPYVAEQASMTKLGLSPDLDTPRKIGFIINIERFLTTGVMANDDPMIIDVQSLIAVRYILMFKVQYKKGRSLQAEGGKFEILAQLKIRVYLPHTSTVVGYGDGADAAPGSSNGLYGLFALIVLPVLCCLALCAYCVYYYMNSAAAMDSYVPQVHGREFTPQPYVPPQSHVQSPYFAPQGYLPAQAAYLPA